MRFWPICILLLATGHAMAQDAQCRKRPDIAGACRTVHGQINNTADGSTILWIGGSSDKFEIVSSKPPDKLEEIFRRDFTAFVYGEFDICPLSGENSFGAPNACIENARKLSVIPLDYIPIPK